MSNEIDLVPDVRFLFLAAEDRDASIRTNPVTGGRWVPGEDSLHEQMEKAERALVARASFASHGPSDCQPLPLTYSDREDMKVHGGLPYMVALYARSMAARDYVLDGHPDFNTYASGLLAIPDLEHLFVEIEPALATRYPPCPLPGLNESGYWCPLQSKLEKPTRRVRKR